MPGLVGVGLRACFARVPCTHRASPFRRGD
jgi:hypothetical protein